MTTLYGIPNCDTVKKARAWLTAQGVGYTFHDFKKQGVPKDRLLLLRPCEVLSRIAHASVLKVAHNALGVLLQHRHVNVGGFT